MINLKEKLYTAVDIPKEAVSNLPFITMVGNEEVVIENYRAVLDYKPQYIKINTKLGVIKIEGDNIDIKFIRKNEISIVGQIRSVEHV